MNRDQFWLTDEQFAKIGPHLPTDTRGKERVDDRRVISGTVNVLEVRRSLDRRSTRIRAEETRQTAMSAGRQGASGSTFEFAQPAQAGGPPEQVRSTAPS